MKKLFLFFFIILSVFVKAQVNLVVNPSFEVYTACPDNTGGDVYKATGWDTCRGTPDYFNTCATSNFFQIPDNYFGHQNAAWGNAYCGLYAYDVSVFYRECIIGSLTTALTVSQKYFVSFKVSCADSLFVNGYSTNKLGVRMSTTMQYNVPINNSAHFYSNTVITDTSGWTRISGYFIADSAYQYIMLGNFFDDANTTTFNFQSGNLGYYYIDEVCLSSDSTYTVNYATGIEESGFPNKINIYPNPAKDVISISGLSQTGDLIKVFNSIGSLISSQAVRQEKTFLNCSSWPSGVYFIQTKNSHQTVIINH